MKPLEIAKDIYWVGAIDWNIRDFHGYATYQGTTYNAFLIMDEKVTLIEWHQRKENHNPLPRGDRFWNDTLYPVRRFMTDGEVRKRNPEWKKGAPKEIPKYLMVPGKVEDKEKMHAATRFIYPMDWVMDHGPTTQGKRRE